MMVEQRAEEREERLDPRQRAEIIDYFIIYFLVLLKVFLFFSMVKVVHKQMCSVSEKKAQLGMQNKYTIHFIILTILQLIPE